MGGLTNLLRIGLLLAGLPMPRPIPLPSQQAVASRTNSPAAVAPRRWAPNIPGTLIRALSQRLGVDGIAAMRIALLYGDIEWQAAPASELRYSASDYARRMGIHRQTVQADLRRLEAIGAIGIDQDPSHGAVLQLHGLGCLGAQGAEPCRSHRQPCRSDRHPPCRSEHHPPVDGVDNPLSMGSTTLEKGLKTQEKKREEKSNPNPNPSPPPEQTGSKASEPSGNQQPPEPLGPSSSEPGSKPNPEPKPCSGPETHPGSGCAPASRPGSGSSSKPETLALAPDTEQAAVALQPRGPTPAASGADGLLADLLDTFRSAAPAEWPRPGRLTLTSGRRSRLKGALAHAGNKQALQEHLRIALEHVPPWFRSTYPLRPDGSRRPSHQFFDLLFRAAAAERDGGPEAWHVFAWSEAAERSAPPGAGPGPGSAMVEATGSESDAIRAQRLFGWGGSSWLMREIEALQLSLAERRRLTALLEHQGQGTPGAGALQFADPPEPTTSPPPKPPMPR
jgi:hypothetical protein